MTDHSSFALRALTVAAIVGFLGDLLLRGASWGINFPIWILTVCLGGLWLAKGAPFRPTRGSTALIFPILLFSLCFAWRDSDELKIANATAIVFCTGAMLVFARAGSLRSSSIGQLLAWAPARWPMLLDDAARLASSDIDWRQRAENPQAKSGAAIGRGLLFTAPLLLLFGGLFMNADAVFQKVVTNAFSFNPDNLMSSVATLVVTSVLAAGIFRRLFLSVDSPPQIKASGVVTGKLGITEASIMLGAMNLLFGVFVVIQFKYLFGGTQLVAVTTGLSYAEYARRGFFELVIVAALLLPLLIALHAILDKEKRQHERAFSWLAGCLVLLLFVVIGSALQRMRIYTDAYGLTTQRLYTTAFMAWLASTFAWLACTVLQGRKQYFAFGSLVAGLVVILGLNVLNPDDLIARTNLARKEPDVNYVRTLSNDAMPTLSAWAANQTSDARQVNEASLQQRRKNLGNLDWREKNLSDLWLERNVALPSN